MKDDFAFNSYGVPQIVEFSNVHIRSPNIEDVALPKDSTTNKAAKLWKKSRWLSLFKPVKPPQKRCLSCGHYCSSGSLHKPSPSPLPKEDHKTTFHRPGGLFIRYVPQSSESLPLGKIPRTRLVQLQQTIADAVREAGMLTPADERDNPLEHASTGDDTNARVAVQSQKLFKGTYGQMKEALSAAGLSAIPCSENGFDNGQSLSNC